MDYACIFLILALSYFLNVHSIERFLTHLHTLWSISIDNLVLLEVSRTRINKNSVALSNIRRVLFFSLKLYSLYNASQFGHVLFCICHNICSPATLFHDIYISLRCLTCFWSFLTTVMTTQSCLENILLYIFLSSLKLSDFSFIRKGQVFQNCHQLLYKSNKTFLCGIKRNNQLVDILITCTVFSEDLHNAGSHNVYFW